MAISYEDWKKQYEDMDTEHRQKYASMVKGNAQAEEYANRYIQESGLEDTNTNGSTNQNNTVTTTQGTNTTTSNTNTSNSNNQNGTNGSYDPIYYRDQNNNSTNNSNTGNTENTGNNNQGGSTLSDGKNGNGNFYGNTSFDKEEQFDKNMIGEDPGKITIEAGTGKTTGRPDYEDSSDARINELTDNLNRYYQTNPEYFADRETFNRQFEYNQRMSDRQRATLDSYWKKAQDIKTASQYTTGDRISAGMDNAEITPDVFNLIKQNNPEAYAQYQKEMQDWINKCMANLSFTGTEPLDVTLERIINKLGIGVGDPHDIKKVYYDSLDKLNVWKDSEQLHVLGNNISSMMSTMNSNAQSLSSQLEGRYSAGYIEARINKANSNIQRQLNTALNSYQMLLQGRQQNIALATQNAQIEQAQAQEEQRIFDDKLKALGFAMDYNSYRTPEQKAALELQKEQISNNMDVLKQSQMNDLALYNKYANAKLDNQLNYEMQDLTVTDPKQLRANLSNILDQWYSQYGDIIERPKSQVIEDVLAYAKNNGVSVGEALRQEFVKKLMGKDEYKKLMNNKLGIKEDTYNYTIDENGNIKITGTGTGSPDLESLRRIGGSGAGTMRTERNNNPTAMTSDVAKSLGGVEGVDYIVGDAFPNNPNLHTAYLLGDPIETTIKLLDNAASTGRGAFYTKGGKQRWTHTAMSDSAWLALTDEEKKNVVLKMLKNEGGDINKMAYYNNGQGNSNGIGDSFEWKNSTYDLSKYSERNGLNDTEKELVKGLLSYTIDPNSLPKSGSENGKTNAKVRAAASVIGRDTGYTEQKYKTTQTIRTNWEKSLQQGGEASRNATAMSVLKSIAESFDSLNNTDFTYVNQLVNWMKKQNGDTDVVALDADVTIAASEMAGALKGNASPTDPEISAMKDLLSGKLSYNQAMEVIKKSAKGLFDKHESEAKGYYDLFGEKPNPIWVDDVADWMANDLGINLGRYYNYDTVTAEDLRQKYFPDVKPAFNITTTNGSLDYTGAAMAVLNA